MFEVAKFELKDYKIDGLDIIVLILDFNSDTEEIEIDIIEKWEHGNVVYTSLLPETHPLYYDNTIVEMAIDKAYKSMYENMLDYKYQEQL